MLVKNPDIELKLVDSESDDVFKVELFSFGKLIWKTVFIPKV